VAIFIRTIYQVEEMVNKNAADIADRVVSKGTMTKGPYKNA